MHFVSIANGRKRPMYVQLALSNQHLAFAEVDMDEVACPSYEINLVPTFRIYKEGKIHGQLVSADDSKLIEFIRVFSSVKTSKDSKE